MTPDRAVTPSASARLRALALGALVMGLLGVGAATALAAGTTWTPPALTDFTSGIDQDGTKSQDPSSVSCSSAGSCVAVGTYVGSTGTERGYAQVMLNGIWGPAVTFALPAGEEFSDPESDYTAVSCAPKGACVAVGSVRLADRTAAFSQVIDAGVFGPPQLIDLPADLADGYEEARFTSISCPVTGWCTAAGAYWSQWDGTPEPIAMTMTMSGFTWGPPAVIDVTSGSVPLMRNSKFTSISCPAVDACAAVGNWRYPGPFYTEKGFSRTMIRGAWAAAAAIEFPAGSQASNRRSLPAGVSCAAPGDCLALGGYTQPDLSEQVFTVRWTGGIPSIARPVDMSAGGSVINASADAVSCDARGSCAITGWVTLADGATYRGYVRSLVNDVWGALVLVRFADGVEDAENSDGEVYTVSCVGGSCAAGGYFRRASGTYAPFTMTSKRGVWSDPVPVDFSTGTVVSSNFDYDIAVDSVACPAAGRCVAVGRVRVVGDDVLAFTTSTVAPGSTGSRAREPEGRRPR